MEETTARASDALRRGEVNAKSARAARMLDPRRRADLVALALCYGERTTACALGLSAFTLTRATSDLGEMVPARLVQVRDAVDDLRNLVVNVRLKCRGLPPFPSRAENALHVAALAGVPHRQTLRLVPAWREPTTAEQRRARALAEIVAIEERRAAALAECEAFVARASTEEDGQ